MYYASLTVFIIGALLVGYIYVYHNASEQYGSIVPFFIGVCLMALGVLSAGVIALVRWLF